MEIFVEHVTFEGKHSYDFLGVLSVANYLLMTVRIHHLIIQSCNLQVSY